MATKRRYKRRTYKKKKRTQKRRGGGGGNGVLSGITSFFTRPNKSEDKSSVKSQEIEDLYVTQCSGAKADFLTNNCTPTSEVSPCKDINDRIQSSC